ncbi:hypothetical protein P879_08879 [Paragonimus westermani]|uniref:Uncharacterized protein n=1 Tax=Paragonimus westermani TaxID=34504 RepID=A0A8T0DIC1_9TREM|nr:hypothetical protein P879_08879 [Paragonimus westermani]
MKYWLVSFPSHYKPKFILDVREHQTRTDVVMLIPTSNTLISQSHWWYSLLIAPRPYCPSTWCCLLEFPVSCTVRSKTSETAIYKSTPLHRISCRLELFNFLSAQFSRTLPTFQSTT